jgi:threonine/homoserine/homoserine lactone efflux protein
MDYATNLGLYFVLVFGIIILPGMDMLYVITSALTGGRKAGLVATAGMMTGGAAHSVTGAVLVGIVLKYAPSLFTWMVYAGGAYMIWIGWQLVRSSITVSGATAAAPKRFSTIFLQALTSCLLNPKAYVFVFSVYPQFMKPQYGSLAMQAVAMGTITVLTQGGVYGGLALAAAKSREFLVGSPKSTIYAGRAAGGLLIAAAGLVMLIPTLG